MKHGECFPPVFVVRSRRDDSFTATVSSRAADPGDIRAAQAAALQQRGSDGFDLIPVPEQQRMDLRPQAFDLGVGNIIARLQLCLIWRTSPLASASPNLMRSASGPARQTQILSSTLERRSRYSPPLDQIVVDIETRSRPRRGHRRPARSARLSRSLSTRPHTACAASWIATHANPHRVLSNGKRVSVLPNLVICRHADVVNQRCSRLFVLPEHVRQREMMGRP